MALVNIRGGRGVLDLPKYSASEGPRTGIVEVGAGPLLDDFDAEGSVCIFNCFLFVCYFNKVLLGIHFNYKKDKYALKFCITF